MRFCTCEADEEERGGYLGGGEGADVEGLRDIDELCDITALVTGMVWY